MVAFTKLEILEKIDDEKKIESAVKYILNKMNTDTSTLTTECIKNLENSIQNLISQKNKRLKDCHRVKKRFINKNKEWLHSIFFVPELKTTFNLPGRPTVNYEDMSERTRRREVSKISTNLKNDPFRILMSARFAAKKRKLDDLAFVLNEILRKQEIVGDLKSAIKSPMVIVKSPEEALAFLLDNNLSKDVYINIRLTSKASSADIWPSYNMVREAKSYCRPPKDSIFIDESSAECRLQPLLYHTTTRIVNMQEEVILQNAATSNAKDIEAIIIYSWGFDGSTGYSQYKQRYTETGNDNNFSDNNLFAITCIPLRLITSAGVVLWNNPTSQSSRFCRPIALKWLKETPECILMQKKAIQDQIDQLDALHITLRHVYSIRIHFSMHLTLIDGKVLNAITNTKSSQACPICHAKPTQFNELSNRTSGNFLPDPNSLQHGLSPLHARIRLLECCLHISYRSEFKRWQVKKVDQVEFAEKKVKVQQLLWEKLGLRVDKPKPGGSGSSNDGNTARRAFQNHEMFANILELNMEFVKNLSTILTAIACHLPINTQKFEALCNQTLQIYVDNYKWYYMPATLHKILIHGSSIIENSILPLGMLAEEAAEARNKNYKNYREFHSRRHSRNATLEDMFLRAMDTSDPQISTTSLKSRIIKQVKIPLPPAVIDLLAVPIINGSDCEMFDEEDFLDLSDVYGDNFELDTEDFL